MSIFELAGISFEYESGRKALDSVDLVVPEGEALSVLGTNGSGKSTLLYILQGLITPSAGTLKVFGDTAFTADKKTRIGIMFQNSQAQLFSLTVLDELMFGPLQHGLGVKEARSRAGDIMELLGITGLANRSPWQLSGGEMKKVALGTCLSTNPDIYLLDEPTSGLDPRSQVELVELVIRLKESGKTIITATHDLHIIQDISERAIIIGEDHRMLAAGASNEIVRMQDVLLKANLIHEHAHKHEGYRHRHSHFGIHEHPADEEEPGQGDMPVPGQKISKQEGKPGMSNLEERLKILLEHWQEHNAEHAKTYLEWAEKAQAAGKAELAATLREIAQESGRLEELFRKAEKQL
ncbi:MAG: ABC transporter ATP-binding protein [Nitrospiraceae bacterium]|nr:ABC transporter ATP-binding protein [Nitrospiraceae bacterium]